MNSKRRAYLFLGIVPFLVVSGSAEANLLDTARAWSPDSSAARPFALPPEVPLAPTALNAPGRSYVVAPSYPSGSGPTSCILRDFDSNGALDLAVACLGESRVRLFEGRGNRTFDDWVDLPLDAPPSWMTSEDLDGDDDDDIIVGLRAEPGGITAFANQGNGAWASMGTVLQGISVGYFTFGDIAGQGKRDLVVSDISATQLWVALADDGWSYAPPARYEVGEGITAMVVEDLDLDGDKDLVFGGNCGAVWTLDNRGDGTFSRWIGFGIAGSVSSIVTGRFRNDSETWIAAAAGTDVTLFRKRNGRLSAAGSYFVGHHGFVQTVGDIDADGWLDIAVSILMENRVTVLWNERDGTFRSDPHYGVGIAPGGIQIGDLDGDELSEIVTADFGSNTYTVLARDASGEFTSRRDIPTTPFWSGVSGDFDSDGRLDAAFTEPGLDHVSLLLASTGFARPLRVPIPIEPFGIAAGDLDRDGFLDIATANAGSSDVAILFGRGDGTFDPAVFLFLGAAPAVPISVDIGDLNGDGLLDLAIADHDATASVRLVFNNGNRTFDPPLEIPMSTAPTSLAIADLQGDGRNDIAVAIHENGRVDVIRNLGPPDFWPLEIGRTPGPRYLRVARWFENPGFTGSIQDVVVSSTLSPSLALFRNGGGLTYHPAPAIALPGSPGDFQIADLDGDGRLDIAQPLASSTTLLIFYGRPDGTTEAPVAITVGRGPASVLAGEFVDPPGLDLMVANHSSSSVSLLRSVGEPAPSAIKGPSESDGPVVSWSPNPAAAAVRLTFHLPRGGDARVNVFDIRGRRVRSLWLGRLPSGTHHFTWDRSDVEGHPVEAGLYFAVLEAGDIRLTARGAIVR